MKRPASPNPENDQPPLTRTKSDGSAIGAYTLTFTDGENIIFEPNVSQKSNLLLNLDSGTPVPLLQFHISSAHALVALISATDVNPSMTPDLYVMTLNLCNYLQMDADVSMRILQQLESPAPEDPLSRLRSCHQSLTAFPTILFDCYNIFKTAEEACHTTEKILSNAEDLTYFELGWCDGKFSVFKKHLCLIRFANGERQRRQERREAAIAKTKELREKRHFTSPGEKRRLAAKAGKKRWHKKREQIEQQMIRNELNAMRKNRNKNKNVSRSNQNSNRFQKRNSSSGTKSK